ncbi:MAG TPA: acyltransferase family protein, partial [Acidimicrobiales bacterium]
ISSALEVALGPSHPDLAYYATFTRAAELLAGCLLAVALRRAPDLLAAGTRRAKAAVAIGPLALAGLVLLTVSTAEQAGWLYRGGLPAFSLLSVALIAGALVPGPLRRLLALRPLVALGLISYGVYLYHWPIFLALSPGRHELRGLDAGELFALRIAVTLVVAIASYVVLERPIRHGRAVRGRAAPLLPIGVAAAVIAAAVVVSSSHFAPPPATAAIDPTLVALPAAPAKPSPLSRRPARIMVFGDSIARTDGAGLIAWGHDTGRASVSDEGTDLGCGIVTGRRMVGVEPQDEPHRCTTWPVRWPAMLRGAKVDLAVLFASEWDLTPHQLPGTTTWVYPGTPGYDAVLRRDLGQATDDLLATGTPVVWVTRAITHPGWGFVAPPPDQDARNARFNQIIRQLAASRPDVHVIDLATYLADRPDKPLETSKLRPDGVHFSPAAARSLADWLGPQLLTAAEAERPH